MVQPVTFHVKNTEQFQLLVGVCPFFSPLSVGPNRDGSVQNLSEDSNTADYLPASVARVTEKAGFVTSINVAILMLDFKRVNNGSDFLKPRACHNSGSLYSWL